VTISGLSGCSRMPDSVSQPAWKTLTTVIPVA
jgi:hypothetical protein